MGSLIMESADANRVAAGGALAVDREGFSEYITRALKEHENVELITAEANKIPGGQRSSSQQAPSAADAD